jgi:hypothetical protein
MTVFFTMLGVTSKLLSSTVHVFTSHKHDLVISFVDPDSQLNLGSDFKYGYEILFSNLKCLCWCRIRIWNSVFQPKIHSFLGFKNVNNYVPVFSLLDWIETSWLQEIKVLGVKMTSWKLPDPNPDLGSGSQIIVK